MIKSYLKSAKFILIFFCLMQFQLSAQVNCPEFLWGKTNEDISQDYYSSSRAVLTDVDGNVYVAGFYVNTLTFGAFSVTATTSAGSVFIAKFSPDGICQWLISSVGYAGLSSFKIDESSGDFLLYGRFTGIATFGTQSVTSSNGASGIYVARFDSQGECTSMKSAVNVYGITPFNTISAFSFESDEAGNIYVAGEFRGTAHFGNIALTASTQDELFIAKLNTNGEWEWANSEVTPQDFFFGELQNLNQHIFLSGYLQGEMDFGNFHIISEGYDLFLAKIDPDGDWISAEKIGGSGHERAKIILDEAENRYVFGMNDVYNNQSATYGDLTLTSTGNSDSYIVKLDPQGEVIWHREITGPHFQCIYSAVLAEDDHIYMTGGMMWESTFGPETLDSPYGEDVFVAKLSADGKWCGALQAVGTYNADYSQSLSVHDSANIYIAGSFSGYLDFSDGLYSNNSIHCFVAKCSMEKQGFNLEIEQSGATLHSEHENAEYQWIHCNGIPILGANQQDFIVSTNGSYAVIVTECGISDTSACLTIQNLGINEQEENTFFEIFPNPAENQLNLILKNNSSPVNWKIMDLSGKLYSENEISEINSTIDVENLSPGIYLLQLESPMYLATEYFVKN